MSSLTGKLPSQVGDKLVGCGEIFVKNCRPPIRGLPTASSCAAAQSAYSNFISSAWGRPRGSPRPAPAFGLARENSWRREADIEPSASWKRANQEGLWRGLSTLFREPCGALEISGESRSVGEPLRLPPDQHRPIVATQPEVAT